VQASALPLTGARRGWPASDEEGTQPPTSEPQGGGPNAGTGDSRAAEETFRTYFTDVWRFLRRLGFSVDAADDAAQDLFFVAVRRLDEIEPGRERAFLLGSALRIAKNLQRKRDREVPTSPDEVDDAVLDEGTPEDKLDDVKARALVYRLLAGLDEDLRVVFVMFELEELTMHEIADLLSIPIGTVASRLRRARDEFRVRLERHRKRHRGAL